MIVSYILYICTLLTCTILGYLANKYNSKVIVNCIIILLVFISGCRGINVGLDTLNYDELWVTSLSKEPLYIEIGYQWLMLFLQLFSSKSIVLFITCSALIYSLTIYRLWNYRAVSSFPVSIAVLYMVNFMPSMNIMRQYCGAAIIFFSIKYLVKGKTVRFIVGVAIATLLHYSCIVALAFLLIRDVLQWGEISRGKKIIWTLLLCLSPFAFWIVLNFVNSEYGHLLESQVNDPGLLTSLKILFIIISFYISMLWRKRKNNNGELLYEDNRLLIKISFSAYLLGTALESLGYFYPFVSRIGMCFYLLGAIYWGVLFKCTKSQFTKALYICALIGLVVLPFALSIINNGQGTMPYTFMWNCQ